MGADAMNLSHLLLGHGLLTDSQLGDALALQRAEGLRLDRALVQLGFITEQQLLELMAQQLHLPLVQLQEVTIAPDILRALPSKVVYRKRLVPIPGERGPPGGDQ